VKSLFRVKTVALSLVGWLLTNWLTYGQQLSVNYELTYKPGTGQVEIIVSGYEVAANSHFIIPRSAPGTYEITDYSAYIEAIVAINTAGEQITGKKGVGSWFYFESEHPILELRYAVDIVGMEAGLKGAFASSKLRTNYLGLLGYSVFGFWENTENLPIHLDINATEAWPVFSTLRPQAGKQHARASFTAANFAHLADAQYLLGQELQLYEVVNDLIPLFVVVYSETPVNLEEIGRRARVSLEGLNNYFSYVPMPYYTVCYEFLIPFSPAHDYGFSMEHLNSMTASMDTSRAIIGYEPKANFGSMVHHMGHSWIPLRAYGKGYRPFEWQTAPIIETIWLHEGFIWYVMTQVLEQPQRIGYFKKILHQAPNYIRAKSLGELSILGSTQYSADFDIGRNLFARGALMAAELDHLINEATAGQKSFQDALLGLLNWTKANKRAFMYDEIEPIMSAATGVNLQPVWQRWQLPDPQFK